MSEKLSDRAMMIDRALDETLRPHAVERMALRDMDRELAALEAEVERLQEQERIVLKAIANALNFGPFKSYRWRLSEAINKELERRGVPFALFDHGGIVDVGEIALAKEQERNNG